ncbi:hypothetical protein HA466_0306440 [Hirschfeldia incana]|nr:hypothetical protein HA466_0306440 [Hirschfeldia incana]KAJ0230533.1 hypothetical protein HA466_0306440 [Hirschfeldia incana]KAJ0230534.1 hypothetical protein HA466_0306440 [Hirschfeldia incana]KAJ0230535.1 hypothetical protein HA466_0306440 [Hirschfeldia incana]KAJ0230536.1 hypothetical protein HA466_0306440 [Hirschfeldia incana]
MTIPDLNTLGVSLARIDYASGGLNPPHTHPRATKAVYVLEGTLDVGFLTTTNKLRSLNLSRTVTSLLSPKDSCISRRTMALPVIAAFNSQLSGTQSLGATLFSSTSPVPDSILAQRLLFLTASWLKPFRHLQKLFKISEPSYNPTSKNDRLLCFFILWNNDL